MLLPREEWERRVNSRCTGLLLIPFIGKAMWGQEHDACLKPSPVSPRRASFFVRKSAPCAES